MFYSFQFQPEVHETTELSLEIGESTSAKTQETPKLKETALRAPRRTGFEPSVEETGSLADLQAEEHQQASQKILAKKDDQFLRREKQRGVSDPPMASGPSYRQERLQNT